jgi:hypothetical protein
MQRIILALAIIAGVMLSIQAPASAMPVATVDGVSVPHVEKIWWHRHWHRWHHWHHWHHY